MRASGFMTTDVLTLHPLTSLKAAAATLAARNVASAPVVDDDGRMVGIVSELDLLAPQRVAQSIPGVVRVLLDDRMPRG